MKCVFSEGVNEMSGLEGGVGVNCKISLISSILSVKNERSCKNRGLKRIMFGPSHSDILSYFFYI